MKKENMSDVAVMKATLKKMNIQNASLETHIASLEKQLQQKVRRCIIIMFKIFCASILMNINNCVKEKTEIEACFKYYYCLIMYMYM